VGAAEAVAGIEKEFDDYVKSMKFGEKPDDLPEADRPNSWVTGSPGTINKAAYILSSPAGKAKLTISRLGGDLDTNVNRWRKQVNQAPLSKEEVAKTPTLTVNGVTVYRVDVSGPYNEVAGKPMMMQPKK
jgi:hypothetical protein